jgi:superfamily II DNA or RNA helicase
MMLTLLNYQQRTLDAIKEHNKGCVYIPTGGGKTVVMKEDIKQRLLNTTKPMTVVIVAPRILLANQLCSEFEEYLGEFDIVYMHVHSGETHHVSSTKPDMIVEQNELVLMFNKHHFIFTTYNSLGRVNDAEISVDVVYFDEAHHCVKPSNFVGIAHTSRYAENAYFFTATPKFNNSQQSMNNTAVYGKKIISIPAQELIDAGSIIPPRIHTYEAKTIRTKENAAYVDAENIIGILNEMNEDSVPKVLVAAPSTRVIWDMFTESDLMQQLNDMGYAVLHVTSKHGAYVNKKKVSREQFFEIMTEYGNDPQQKFIVFHYSILSEGMNVSGLTHCIMLRNLPLIEMAQTIGRVIRMNKDDRKDIQDGKIAAGQFAFYRKPFGTITVPVQNNYGDKIARQLESVVNAIFVKGELCV